MWWICVGMWDGYVHSDGVFVICAGGILGEINIVSEHVRDTAAGGIYLSS